jgi:GDP-L-fucose synthase
VVWGTGAPLREFLHVDDLASAAVFLMQNYDEPEIVNVGVGKDLTIADLARTVAHITGYKGSIEFDRSKPDGTPRKLMDASRLHAMGWHHSISLEQGIRTTYEWFLANYQCARAIAN